MTNVIPFRSRAELKKPAVTAISTIETEALDDRPDTPVENISLATATPELSRKDAEKAMKYIFLQAHKIGLKVLQNDQKKTSAEGEEARHVVMFALKGPKDKVFAMEDALKSGDFLNFDFEQKP